MPIRKDQKKLTGLIKDIKNKKFKYESKEKEVIDWAAYSQAQIDEINNQLILIRKLVDRAEWDLSLILYDKKVGQPPKNPADKAKAILLQQYFQASNRVAAGLVRLFREKLGIKEHLTYKDIERAYDSDEVVLILERVFELTNEAVEESEFSVDGTGLSTSIK